MAPKKDVIRKRLLSTGVSPEACMKYVETFRTFLDGRITKLSFEDEINKILPRDKFHVHNDIVQEILSTAQQKREGLRDLPIVTPIKERRPVPTRKERPTSQKGPPPPKLESKPVKTNLKRLHEEIESQSGRSVPEDSPNMHVPKKQKRNPSKNKTSEITDRPKLPKPKAQEKPSPKARRRTGESTTALPPPSPSPSITHRAHPRPSAATSTDIPTYDGLPYFPVRPGQSMDINLFVKLRQRMRKIAVEQIGMASVKDDAVALMLHGLEAHVKGIMAGGARQRVGRDGIRPHRNVHCGPIRPHDVREVALRNTTLLGDESGMDLERLLMLL